MLKWGPGVWEVPLLPGLIQGGGHASVAEDGPSLLQVGHRGLGDLHAVGGGVTLSPQGEQVRGEKVFPRGLKTTTHIFLFF